MQISVTNRQRRVPVDLGWLRSFARKALPVCLAETGSAVPAVLPALEEVAIVVVSDRVIAEVHAQFMDNPEPTDVITFDHGEIVCSAETAQRAAAEHGHGVSAEIALYTVHGLLHLNGFNDTDPQSASAMHAVQNRLWEMCLGQLPTPRF